MRVCEWRASSVRGHMRTSVRAYSALGAAGSAAPAVLGALHGLGGSSRETAGVSARKCATACTLSHSPNCRSHRGAAARPSVSAVHSTSSAQLSADRLRRFARWSEANRARPEVSASPCRADVFTQPFARRCSEGTRSTANATSNEKTGSQPVIPVRVDQVAIQTPPGSLTPAA
jgi:hypothetical protein